MADDGAPVCNLPNIGQVPPLQSGILRPSIPKAQDLPSLVQAVNTISQIVTQLVSPGSTFPTFRNNLAPVTLRNIVGTAGIVGAAGSDGSAARAGKDGKDGKKAKDPKWRQGDQKSEKVKVKGTEDNEECFLIMRRVTHLTMISSVDGQKKIEWQGTVGGAFGGPIEMGQPLPGTGSEGRPFTGTEKSDRETVEENPIFPSRSTNGSGMASNPFQPGLMADCVGVKWGARGCRFAVCGYDGIPLNPPFDPRFFGVGAYSDDGKSWTTFKVFENGGATSAFYMRDPKNKKQNILVVGGNLNDDSGDVSFSTAKLTTIVGSGPSVGGGQSEGRNVANFGSLGYDKKKGIFYAVESSGGDGVGQGQHAILHTFPIGDPSSSNTPSTSKNPSILWTGSHYPGIGPVYDCSCVSGFFFGDVAQVQTFKDKSGKEHTLAIVAGQFLLQLLYDGENITPSGARHVVSAAGGVNDAGETIIIAVGFSLKGTPDDQGIAWWSIEGKGWSEITGIWSEHPSFQTALMATAVPNF